MVKEAAKNEIESKNNTPAQAGPVMNGLEAFAKFKQKGAPIVGLEELSPEDIKMPRLKLAQPTSAEVTDEKCKAGEFLNLTTGEASAEIRCHLLSFKKSRVMWPDVFKRGDKPLCRSMDGEMSDDGTKRCASCKDCVWVDGERPACGMVYSWMGVLENGSPFRINFSGAGISKNKDLLTELSQHGLPAFVYNMILTSEKLKNEKGTYYVTNFTLEKDDAGGFKTINPDDFEKFEELTISLGDIFNKARAQDLSQFEEAGPDDEGTDPNGKRLF